MPAQQQQQPPLHHEALGVEEDVDDHLDADDAAEEIAPGDNDDVPMGSDDEAGDEDVESSGENEGKEPLRDDSVARFDGHSDSIFCIAAHPRHPDIVVTGGGDDVGYIFDSRPSPSSSSSGPIEHLAKLDGHTDSIVAVAFTRPDGDFALTAGLDGKLRAWAGDATARKWRFAAESEEVQEINWLVASPHPDHPNVVALGAEDGSVWVYSLGPSPPSAAEQQQPELTILKAYSLHQESCTAGAWTPDGSLLVTVSQDSSLYVWDPFGDVSGTSSTSSAGQALASFTAADERLKVDGGLFAIAVSPNGALAVAGGAGGHIRIIRLPSSSSSTAAAPPRRGGRGAAGTASAGTASFIAAHKSPTDGIETLAFTPAPAVDAGLNFLAAGSLDGSIALFDVSVDFALRNHIPAAHGSEAVVKLQFSPGPGPLKLTSCGNDGVLRRWYVGGGRGRAAVQQQQQQQQQQQPSLEDDSVANGHWMGHRGGGEGGGIMDFVQVDGGNRVVTAGDDGRSLVFSTPMS